MLNSWSGRTPGVVGSFVCFVLFFASTIHFPKGQSDNGYVLCN